MYTHTVPLKYNFILHMCMYIIICVHWHHEISLNILNNYLFVWYTSHHSTCGYSYWNNTATYNMYVKKVRGQEEPATKSSDIK